MPENSDLTHLVQPLLIWYGQSARVLPWRKNHDPYGVWVSEIMLQQTRVEAVIPFYERFLERLPNVFALAAARENELLKLWEGLGYYSRVRNMQKAAQIIVEQRNGLFPQSVKELEQLPGFGSYTAGAVASIAFGLAVPAVDGNVLRVLARIRDDHRDIAQPGIKKEVSALLSDVIPAGRAGDFNQALMELGATVCLPNGEPKCLLCPVRALCKGYSSGTSTELPIRAAKKQRRKENKTIFLLCKEKEVALMRRADTGLLAGMWQPFLCDGKHNLHEATALLAKMKIKSQKIEQLPDAKHIFSHVEWHMSAYRVEIDTISRETYDKFTWVSAQERAEKIALPSAFHAYVPFLP